MKLLSIIGASGHGQVLAEIATISGYGSVKFYDDRWPTLQWVGDYQVVGSVNDAIRVSGSKEKNVSIVGIGDPEIRFKIQRQLKDIAPALVHPRAILSSNVKLGRGSCVMPGAIINTNAIIGEGVIINSGAIVEHDCMISDYAHICPSAALAGGVSVGRGSWVGIGASVIQKVRIGSRTVVGAGAVVINDIEDNQTVVGNPSQPVKR
ncbi:acetyltransferase [Idiomarina sp.]|uniref:acetyltransferase n=1 Tax=Idiomarina sp. TaxID=1874361 RepID=UPI001DC47F3C|nr:acetyltransferase [Idiomarina sp.]MCJ8316211.1 acetyltransferase [Idiomarina sp.]NQZ16124.1 acetyltransferase [Idiomarina sp.]